MLITGLTAQPMASETEASQWTRTN